MGILDIFKKKESKEPTPSKPPPKPPKPEPDPLGLKDAMARRKRAAGLEDDSGVYTKEKGPPPFEPDDASAAPKPKKEFKFAKGGKVKGGRGDGCCERGHTKGGMC